MDPLSIAVLVALAGCAVAARTRPGYAVAHGAAGAGLAVAGGIGHAAADGARRGWRAWAPRHPRVARAARAGWGAAGATARATRRVAGDAAWGWREGRAIGRDRWTARHPGQRIALRPHRRAPRPVPGDPAPGPRPDPGPGPGPARQESPDTVSGDGQEDTMTVITRTELENVDALRAEVDAAHGVCDDLQAAWLELGEWMRTLPDRVQAAPWHTAPTTTAATAVAEASGEVRTTGIREALDGLQSALAGLEALREQVEASEADGDAGAYRAA